MNAYITGFEKKATNDSDGSFKNIAKHIATGGIVSGAASGLIANRAVREGVNKYRFLLTKNFSDKTIKKLRNRAIGFGGLAGGLGAGVAEALLGNNNQEG